MESGYIFLALALSFGAISADWTNLTKSRLQLLYELPKDLRFPALGFVDRIIRRDGNELSGWFGILLLFLPLPGAILFQWYYLFLTPIAVAFGYIIAGMILPEQFSQWYARQTAHAVEKSALDAEQKAKLIHEIERLSSMWGYGGGKRRTDRIWKSEMNAKEREAAFNLDVYLVWYDDRFERFSDTPSSFLHAVCLTREQAEELVSRRPFNGEGNWDGYEMSGPSNLLQDYADNFVNIQQVRQLLHGESPTGPKYD